MLAAAGLFIIMVLIIDVGLLITIVRTYHRATGRWW